MNGPVGLVQTKDVPREERENMTQINQASIRPKVLPAKYNGYIAYTNHAVRHNKESYQSRNITR